MQNTYLALILLAILVALPLVFVLVQYNKLIGLRNYVRESWSGIDTELKRRYDLIPNLVATVKGYAQHEAETLERITALRNQCAANSGRISEQARDEQLLVAALQGLFALVEDYPDLKANENYLQLQRELVNTEDRIQAARRFFNGNVRDYRNQCQQFPSNIVAGMFGFELESYFEVDPSVREVPSTQF